MMRRCSKKDDPYYPYYGGRGISVCKRWLEFPNFLADMGERPLGMTLERVRNNEGYSPDNCRWASRKEQMKNQRRNKPITFNGTTLLLYEWAERLNVPKQRIRGRILRGWTVEAALFAPAQRMRKDLKNEKRNLENAD
jgi:hypothetical protein